MKPKSKTIFINHLKYYQNNAFFMQDADLVCTGKYSSPQPSLLLNQRPRRKILSINRSEIAHYGKPFVLVKLFIIIIFNMLSVLRYLSLTIHSDKL